MKKTDISRYGDGNDTRMVNLGSIAFFSSFTLTTNSGKHLDDNSQAHIVSLMYKILPSSRGGDDLSLAFHPDRIVRREEIACNKT